MEKISFHPNEGAWVAILSGCRRREGNLELAAKVVDRLLEMHPEGAAGHLVLLSNMYAGVGQSEGNSGCSLPHHVSDEGVQLEERLNHTTLVAACHLTVTTTMENLHES